ncbi:NB-ARC domain-containing protein [Crossiella sp. CA-258035]|uniref:AfsR/SARP family transcriptional regulator n=1 Tax=Crossiella sp. CA-258035 TaxID=2981138 RepID=UPI0024BCEE08|nr:NB-ARC domain-containing protein [Crossiella sp. CA-258035]WHT22138.1 NB-ARC domain-containing protein [Crossiella sp. CA-258035]
MSEQAIELQVLGTVRLVVNGKPVPLEPRLSTVLAIAAVLDGQVDSDDLAARFDASRTTVRGYGTMLRRRAGFDLVKKNQNSILRLALGREQVDLWRFNALVAEARSTSADQKLRFLLAATELWQGPPLAGLDPRLVEREIGGLRAAGRRVFLDLIRLCAAQKGAEPAIVHAERASKLFADDDETREVLWDLWSQCGQAQAIMDDLRKVEDERRQLGSPFTGLRRKAKAFISQARRVAKTRPAGQPYQLPPIRADLRGRGAELAVLGELIVPDSGVQVVSISGLGGLGKTELAVQWAHSALDHFPDGVLFVDLQGYSPVGPTEPAAVLTGFVNALDPMRTNWGHGDVLAAYRTLVNTRAVLVVIDNARDHQHAADLVAAGERSRTVITTRAAVTAPAVARGRTLPLRPLTVDACLAVLRDSVGVAWARTNPFAVRNLMAVCGGFPLAVKLVAAQAHLNKDPTFERVLARLGSPHALLGAKPDGEAKLHDSLKFSYELLSPEAAWVLQVIAIHPGPTIAWDVVGFLSGLPEHTADEAIDELQRGNLLDSLPDNRYRVHDFVRAFALKRATAERGDLAVAEVRKRLLGWLLASAQQCDRALRSGRELPDDLCADEGAPLPEPADDAEGSRWFEREHATLLAVLDSPDFQTFTAYRWRLPLALCCYHTRNGPWLTAERLLASAYEIPKDELDERERVRYQAVCHRVLGNIQRKLGKSGAAEHNLTTSIALASSIGDPLEVANGHQQMGVLQEDKGQWETARRHMMIAGDLYENLKDERGLAATLPTEIHCHLQLGEPERALEREEFAVAVMARASTPYNQGALHRVLMSCYLRVEQDTEAIAHGEAARACYVESNSPVNEARVLSGLAHVYRAAGRIEEERDALLSCLAIYRRRGSANELSAEDRSIRKAVENRLVELAGSGG